MKRGIVAGNVLVFTSCVTYCRSPTSEFVSGSGCFEETACLLENAQAFLQRKRATPERNY